MSGLGSLLHRLRITFVPILGAVLLAAAAGMLWQRRSGGPEVPAQPARALPPTAGWRPPSSFEPAAQAVRDRDFARVRGLVEPLIVTSGQQAQRLRLILALYAHACGEAEEAERLLLASSGVPDRLEDWRLLLLGEIAGSLGHRPVAQAALLALLTDHPDSTLRSRALVAAVRLALESGDGRGALSLIEQARGEELRDAERGAIDRLAWEIGESLDDEDVRRQAARRLLVHDPEAASELGVEEVLRDEDGRLAWLEILSREELLDRARALLATDRPGEAITLLDALPEAERAIEARLLQAEALTRSRRGREALELLAAVRPQTADEEVALEWARAQASNEAATVRAGRSNLPADERTRRRHEAIDHLWRVVHLGTDRDRSIAALRRLYPELIEEGLFEEAMRVLHRLRRIEPSDTTGARHLWELGWSHYRDRNPSGAIGYWSELESLYPESRFARAGRYWSGRAYESLGQQERARRIYRELASSATADFYGRNARARLGDPRGARTSISAPQAEPWPTDPLLSRARFFTDLGLDRLALVELDQLAGKTEPRAWLCLRALVLARSGERRESIQHLWRAFPALGQPDQESVPSEALRLYYPLAFGAAVSRHAAANGLPEHLVLALIRQESAFDPAARSRAGARGLMQLMPPTAREVARRIGLPYSVERLIEPEYSIALGTAYFRQMMALFDDTVELALAGYNGGPNRIRRLWRRASPGAELDAFVEDLEPEETRTFVKRVLLFTDSYEKLYPEAGSAG